MAARGENPFEAHRIHSRAVRSICPLEYNKRGYCVHSEFESSLEKSRPVRSRQDPTVANSRVKNARILGATRDRAPAASPNFELVTALLGAVLSNSKRYRQKHC